MASKPSSPAPVTLDQLIALSDEIAALVRAGVPLEPALAELGSDLPGRLGKLATALADRAGEGRPLLEVLGEQSAHLPPVYRAVVEVGLRSGRLASALESLAGSMRRLAETRRGVASAALYPLLVVALAWCFFAFFAVKIAPAMLTGSDLLSGTARGVFGWIVDMGHTAAYWGPAGPLVILMMAGLWWCCAGRAAVVQPCGTGRLLGWLPWMGRTLRWSRTATFVEVLALLIENRVPLHEAVVLAAQASGDPRLMPAARQLAAALERGERLDARQSGSEGFPPLLLWLMAAAERQGALLPALRHAAETYRRRALHQADLARVFLPVLMTIAIGGSITLLYALMLFVPYTSMLRALGGP